jgi:hypothetical protein
MNQRVEQGLENVVDVSDSFVRCMKGDDQL